VVTGPGDEMTGAVGGRGSLRASHADREHVIDTLKAAFVQGRLTKDELGTRVGHVLASRTYADLAAVTADIPAGVAANQPPQTPARGRTRKPISKVKVVAWGASVISALAALVAVAALLANNNDSDATLFFASALTFIGASMIAWPAMAEARAQNRSRGRLPQGPAPGAGTQASQRTASAAEAEQFPQINHGQQQPTEAAQDRLPRARRSSSRPPRQGRPRGLLASGRTIAVQLECN
jgi:Domain of unknown function (DUF1707)